MNYASFVVLTDTPTRLRNFLVSRGVIEETEPGSGNFGGVLPGMEWVEVPNPIITTPAVGEPLLPGGTPNPAYVPAVYDTRRAFMVKFAHDSVDSEVDGPTVDEEGNPISQYDWSKFGKWVKNNSSIVTAPVNYTINGEPVGDAYKIDGENVWLVRDRPERFGGWQ